MKRSILFVGNETNFGSLLIEKLSNNASFVFAFTNIAKNKSQENTIRWNQSSPVSAKNLVLEADRLLNPLDEIWICLPNLTVYEEGGLLSLPAIENVVNEHLRGILLLFREAQRFGQQRPISLRFFFLIENRNNVSPLLSLVYEGLGAFLRSHQQSNTQKNLKLIVYENYQHDVPGFLDMITKSIELKNESGWFAYPRSLFSWQGTKNRRSIV
jgi:hypothetical protein